jgi:CheY-like chemotaxis protein
VRPLGERLPKTMPKILLVEDNEMNRDMLSRRLRRKGYLVTMAVDGQSALEMSQTDTPSLILMDVGLPVLDGWEATRRLKANPATRHIPVIALTAHALSSDRKKAFEAGCDDYETKPIDLPRLRAKIEALLNKSVMAFTGEPPM